jgi:hypothetical protein
MVICGRLCYFAKKPAQILWLYDAEVICEREKPTEVPVPSAAFNHKGHSLFVPFLAEDLEWSFFPDPLRCNWIDLNRTVNSFWLIIPSPKEIG